MLAVDQIIPIRHEIMIVEDGGDRIVLKHVSAIRTAGAGAGTGNQIPAVGKLELEKTDRNGIQVEQWVRYRTCRAFNLDTAIGCRIVGVSHTIARRLWAER